jgi:hypothetical protein
MRIRTTPLYVEMALIRGNGGTSTLDRLSNLLEKKYYVRLDHLEKR